MRARSWVRAGLIFFGVGDALIGAFAYLLPHHFYNDVPTVALDPPFNQHFVTDVGAFYIAQAVVLVLAAIVMELWLVRAALAGYVTFAILHLAFHASHLAGMPAHDAIVLVTALALDAAIPLTLLIMAGSRAEAGAPAEVEYRPSGSPRRSDGQTVE